MVRDLRARAGGGVGEKMKPTLRELEDIISKPDNYYVIVRNGDGSVGARHKRLLDWIRDEMKYLWWKLGEKKS